MTVDEMIADIRAALELEDNQVPVSLVVACEYVDLDPDADQPEQRRLSFAWSTEMTWWSGAGIAEAMRHNFVVLGIEEDTDE